MLKNLTYCLSATDTYRMVKAGKSRQHHVADILRQRIDRGGERLWRYVDFVDLPFAAVAQALSRLARSGQIDRLSKGTYYRSRATAFGQSRPNPAAIRQLASRNRSLFPSGIAAANLLGFTTQNPQRVELATSGLSLPRKLVGPDAIIHTRRPEAWSNLTPEDVALLEFLRCGGRTSDLSPEAAIDRLMMLLSESGRYGRLLKVARTEPPRMRAMLGALGEQLKRDRRESRRLRASLNPLSRFNFGLLASLPNATAWYAKACR